MGRIRLSAFFSNFAAGFQEKFDLLIHSLELNFFSNGRYMLYLDGLKTTILLSLAAIALGVVLGLLATYLRRSTALLNSRFALLRGLGKILHAIGYIYVDVIRATPTMVQLMIITYVVFATSSVSKFFIAFIAFSLNSGAYISEIFRAGLDSIDKGQNEAGRSLGLSATQTMLYIILPQAVRNVLPALANEFIMLIKETAIVGLIALDDLTRAGEIVRSVTYAPYTPLIISAIMYYVVVKVLTLCLGAFERWLKKSEH